PVFAKRNQSVRQSKPSKNQSNFKFKTLLTTLKRATVGTAILTGFLLTMAQFTMIVGFQTFSVDILKITPTQIGIFYAGFGICGIVMQLLVPVFTKLIPKRSVILLLSTILCFAAMFLAGL